MTRPEQMDATYSAVMRFLDRHIIQHMVELHGSFGPLETCFHIRNFTNETITYDMARALCRSLTDRGYCRYHCGLFTEDGHVAGAGYGLTRKGLEYYEELCPETEGSTQ
jgi:hypothetical protein